MSPNATKRNALCRYPSCHACITILRLLKTVMFVAEYEITKTIGKWKHQYRSAEVKWEQLKGSRGKKQKPELTE